MATLVDYYNLRYGSTELKARVVVAVAAAALNIYAEATGIAGHPARLTWAQNALGNTPDAAERMMWGVIANSAVLASGNGVTDGQVLTIVSGLVNSFTALV